MESNQNEISPFITSDDLICWRSVGDPVMGGCSTGVVSKPPSHDYVSFHGEVSTANGGGFSSVRGEVKKQNLERVQGFFLQIRGDGKTYAFRLITQETGESGVVYHAEFATLPKTWLGIRLSLDNFEARIRGQRVSPSLSLAGQTLRGAGFLVGNKQEGEFCLDVRGVYLLF